MSQINILKPTYYNEFACIGSDCKSNCCIGWKIDIDERSYKKYQNVPGAFGERLREGTEGKQFAHHDGACVFLNEDKLCGIYKELGEDAMCVTCKQYPRSIKVFDTLVQSSLTLSCPEVARIVIEKKEPITYLCEETNVYNCQIVKFLFEENKEFLAPMFEVQSTIIDMMQLKKYPLFERLATVLLYANQIQTCMEKDMVDKMEHVTTQYSESAYIKRVMQETGKLEVKETLQSNLIYFLLTSKICRSMMSCTMDSIQIYNRYIANRPKEEIIEFLNEHMPAYTEYMKGRSNEYENYYVHMIFHRVMECAKDKKLMKFIVSNNISMLLIRLIGLFYWHQEGELTQERQSLIISWYARVYQHNASMYNEMYEALETSSYHTLPYQIAILKYF